MQTWLTFRRGVQDRTSRVEPDEKTTWRPPRQPLYKNIFEPGPRSVPSFRVDRFDSLRRVQDAPLGQSDRPTVTLRVPPAGCEPDRRARLDTIVRLCDLALWDLDVPMEPAPGAVWVVRRTVLEVQRWPVAAETLSVSTWASAAGRVWAERRIDLTGQCGAGVRLATLWASVDPISGRPTRLSGLPGVADPRRRVPIGLTHLEPPDGSTSHLWPIRRSDIDVLNHVNNSVIWTAWEDTECGAVASVGAGGRFETEYRSQLFHGPCELTRSPDGTQVWLGVPGERPAVSVRSV